MYVKKIFLNKFLDKLHRTCSYLTQCKQLNTLKAGKRQVQARYPKQVGYNHAIVCL